jgi:hypothetical protein
MMFSLTTCLLTRMLVIEKGEKVNSSGRPCSPVLFFAVSGGKGWQRGRGRLTYYGIPTKFVKLGGDNNTL